MTPANLEVQKKILDLSATLSVAISATKIEPAQRWFTYVIPDCPTSFHDLVTGEERECGPIIHDEIVSQTGLAPIRHAPSQHSDPGDPKERETAETHESRAWQDPPARRAAFPTAEPSDPLELPAGPDPRCPIGGYWRDYRGKSLPCTRR